jgi:hypothetical protein
MSESKTYVFGNDANGANNNLLASILPALQNRGIDSSYLMGLMSGNNNGGFFGNNGGFQDIIALIVIAAIFGNGNFGFGGWGNNGNNMVASTAEREMLLSAIQRNGVDLSQLASTLNCSVGRLDDAIGQVATQICNLTGQLGMSSQQIINSVQFGNSQLANQIANCCCDLKSSLASCCCDIQRDIATSTAATTRGFADVGYALRDQTCNIEKAIAASTSQILEGQRAAEMRELQDKLDAAREKNSQQAVILNNAQQTSQFAAMLAPLQADLAELKCNQVPVKKIACPEQYVPLNTSVNATYGLIPTCGYNTFGGWGWNGYNNGNCCGNSLWG